MTIGDLAMTASYTYLHAKSSRYKQEEYKNIDIFTDRGSIIEWSGKEHAEFMIKQIFTYAPINFAAVSLN